ncbi:unnamed protein product, partial [Coregonus sp. 'balchen']
MYRVRDFVRKQQVKQIAQQMQEVDEEERAGVEECLRPITQLDLLFGLDKMRVQKSHRAPGTHTQR